MEFAPSARRCVSVVVPMLILAFVVLVPKVGARLRMRRVGWDDNFAFLSFVASVPATAVIYMQAEHGMGYRSKTLSPDDLRKQSLYFWLSVWLYLIALSFAKLSILAQYLRIFIGRRTTIVTKLFMWIVALYSLQGLIVSIFQCYPIHHYWDRSGKGRCFDAKPYYYAFSAFNIFLGVAIVVIPVPALNELRLPLSQKLGLLGVFFLATLSVLNLSSHGTALYSMANAILRSACAISVVRLCAVVHAMRSGDPGHTNPMPAMWSMVEVHVYLICGCLPSLRPILAQFCTRAGSSNGRNSRRRSTPFDNSPFMPTLLPHMDDWPEGQELQGQVLQFDHWESPSDSDGKPLEQKSLLTYVRGVRAPERVRLSSLDRASSHQRGFNSEGSLSGQ